VLKQGKKNSKELSEKQKKYNAAVHDARARVETIFGILKKKFEVLAHPFREDTDQLDAIVYLAAGVNNFQLK